MKTTRQLTLETVSGRQKTIFIDGHKTSFTLEDAFWYALKEIAVSKNISLPTSFG